MAASSTYNEESSFESFCSGDRAIAFCLNLFNEIQADANLAVEFSQMLNFREIQLGEPTDNYITGSSIENVYQEQIFQNFYMICQGRVRLLASDPLQQREVSVQVLEAGETFGAESITYHKDFRCLPYRAIAASKVQIAQMKADDLHKWLKRLPNLQEYLQRQTEQRQRQIFFKTLTDLRRLSSQQIREFTDYLVELRMAAGQSLAQTMSADAGRYWLYSGKWRSAVEDGPKISQGMSWGYPDGTVPSFVAETDSVLYHLPKENWSAAVAIAPGYFTDSGNAAGKPKEQKNKRTRRPGNKGTTSKSFPIPDPSPSPQLPVTNSRNESVDFPKPVRRIRWPWQRYPLILQQSSSDCGAACLAMISLYWGKRFTLNFLREITGVGRDGASLKNLAKAAESLGYQARPVRASLSKLADGKNPWIAHWQGIHYIVVYRCKGARVIVADPAQGKRAIPRQEFLDNWTGYALLLDPTQRLQQVESQKLSLKNFLGALSPYRSLIGQIILASLLIQVFSVVTPLFNQIIFDQVVVNKSFTTLNVFILGLLLFNVWNICLGAVRQYLLLYFSNRLNLTLVGGFISHAMMLPLKFFESRRVGDITTRVQENQKIQRFLIDQVVLAWLDMVMGVTYLGLMLYYNVQLTLLVLALIPPIIILTLVATPMLRELSREVFKESAEQNSLVVEMFSGISTIKATAAEREIRWRWEDSFTSFINVGFRAQKLAIVLRVVGGSINTLGSTALLWYGATLVIQDQLTIGQFMAFNMMIGRVISPFLTLTNLWDRLQEVLISVERLNDVFEAQPEETPGKPMLILPRLRGEVRFENVTFRYNSEQETNTLQNISFEAHPGQSIAIVGRSGSGKSTLVKMLQGLYLPDSGRITVDGHDVRLISPQSLRSQLGVVPQDCFLFSGTIVENISLYRPEFTLEEVTEVAKLAEAHAFIQSLPFGYNTKVGERGSSLSGGQRQRIAIARALLGDPRILVLDEATSSLDTESERRFQQNLERLCRDRTTFIIAHRLSTVRNADNILVLDRGILVEQGNHSELMALQGLYYHLAQQQLSL